MQRHCRRGRKEGSRGKRRKGNADARGRKERALTSGSRLAAREKGAALARERRRVGQAKQSGPPAEPRCCGACGREAEGRGTGPSEQRAACGEEERSRPRGNWAFGPKMREGRFYFFPNPFSFLNSKQFQIRTKSSINTIQNTLFSSNINEAILGKFSENNFLNSFIFF